VAERERRTGLEGIEAKDLHQGLPLEPLPDHGSGGIRNDQVEHDRAAQKVQFDGAGRRVA
jgi:hypothetical protein